MSYIQQQDGDVVQPKMKGYKMKCCDCGLVHRIDFFVVKWGRGHKVRFQVWRDQRSTAAGRRGKKATTRNGAGSATAELSGCGDENQKPI